MRFPPLVAPSAALSADEIRRYSRHLLLPDVGIDGQRRLKTARVLVVGAGGLGSPVLLYLAAAGIGTLGIVEFDTVDESNLQRQVIHGMADLGRPKAQSARDAIAALNPHVEVRVHAERLGVANALDRIAPYDLVIDGTDNFATRYLLNDACVLSGKPYVWGSIFRFEGQTTVFWDAAPGGARVNYRDLYPAPPPPELAPSCSEGGVFGVLCAAIGATMATEAIKLVTGIGESLHGRLAVHDALDMTWRFMPLRRAPGRAPIRQLADYQALCGLVPTAGEREPVATISARELQDWQRRGERFQLVDVRERTEWDIVRIPGAIHLPISRLDSPLHARQLQPDRPIVLHCKSGLRSRSALLALRERGYTDLKSLEGGILAWIRDVDPSLPSY